MASEQTFSTSDLRSASMDYKRDNESKHKWAQGEAWGPGRPAHAHSRPARLAPKRPCSNKELGVRDAKMAQRHEILEETLTNTDSSADEDLVEPSAAPEPDAEVTYSYDQPRGANHGSQILSLALAKAVERYENTVTDKLVKDEYEVLDESGEVVPKKPGKKPVKNVAINDDEYEIV